MNALNQLRRLRKGFIRAICTRKNKTRPHQDACLHKTQTSRINGTCRLEYDATLLRRVPSKKDTCS